MAGTFDKRLAELAARLPDGEVKGVVTFDQIYALAIHSGYWRIGRLAGVTNRPRHGGETHFLTNALHRNGERYARNLASAALEPGGLAGAMAENMEDLARDAGAHAPRESGALGNSGHPVVTVDGRETYDRPPLVPRLTREQLHRRHDFVPRASR